jgi:hemin uptake protein HemP
MTTSTPQNQATSKAQPAISPHPQVLRLNSREMMQQMREVEIDHEGKIYRLRITQLNKLILTV